MYRDRSSGPPGRVKKTVGEILADGEPHGIQEAEGHAALSDRVTGVHAQFPDDRLRRLSGIDVGELADDGRLRRVTEFSGEPPPLD